MEKNGDDVKQEPKHYVIDTSAIMDDYKIISALGEGNQVYIHARVIDELDYNKDNPHKSPFARGNARRALNYLIEVLPKMNEGKVLINEGRGTLHIIFPTEGKTYHDGDSALLDYLHQEYQQGQKPILITEDAGLLARALANQYKAEVRRDTRKGKSIHEILNMKEEIDLPYANREELRAKKSTSLEAGTLEGLSHLYNNQYLYLTGDCMALKHRTEGKTHTFNAIHKVGRGGLQGILPKNREQEYLMDLCLDENIRIASVMGQAGTGKTLIPLAVALHLTMREKKYKRIVIIRPVQTIGQDLGYLPGDLAQKMNPLMGAIRDAAEVILDNPMRRKFSRSGDDGNSEDDEDVGEIDTHGLDYLINQEKIIFMTPTYVRGRNIPNSFMIVDEAQNLDEDITKTIATRVGDSSKIIFNGDPYQIDASYLDQEKNGLIYLAKNLLGEKLFSTVILKKGERSEVAELAARLL
ncbi:MAG: PhoH family protein [Nanoarchaeota archaeon]